MTRINVRDLSPEAQNRIKELQGASALAPRKYRNVPTAVDGITFASKREAKRYIELKMLLRAGEIRSLRRQVTFHLRVGGVHVCDYRADFVYTDKRTGKRVVEDAKGVRTKEFIIKKALMLACLGIEVVET